MTMSRIPATMALILLAACGSGEPTQSLEAKADGMEDAADRAPDSAQAEVLDNQAQALREAEGNDDKVDSDGSVTVIEE